MVTGDLLCFEIYKNGTNMLSSDVACCFDACMPYVSDLPLFLPLSPHLLLLYLAQECPIPDGLGPTKGYFPSKGNFSSPLLLVWRFYIFSGTAVWMALKSFTCLSGYFNTSQIPAVFQLKKKNSTKGTLPPPLPTQCSPPPSEPSALQH